MPLPSVLDELDRLFDELIRRPWGATARHVVPIEFHEVEDGWLIQLPVEDLRAADLQIEVHGRHLTVTGHRRRAHERRQGQEWSRTQRETSLHRVITLPAEADPDDIDAKVEGSTLSVHVRKRSK